MKVNDRLIDRFYPDATVTEKKKILKIGFWVFIFLFGIVKIVISVKIFGAMFSSIGFEKTVVILLTLILTVLVFKNQKTFI